MNSQQPEPPAQGPIPGGAAATPPSDLPAAFPPLPYPVLFSNAQVLAINKPIGVAAIPEGANDTICLRTKLEAALGTKIFVVHRLDKDVSGVIIFARDAETHRFLNLQFSERLVHKTYLALVRGVLNRAQGKIPTPLREFGSGRMGVDREHGKPSVTRYRVRERFPAHTLLEVEPLTGRRHQIRVHLYSIGFPIEGDPRYGDVAQQRACPRLMLHAAAIALPLPGGETVRIEAPMPATFQKILADLRANSPGSLRD